MIIIPDQKYNPNFLTESDIKGDTKLAPGVSLSKFLGTKGNATSLNTSNVDDKKQLLRNLYVHAEMFRMINGNVDMFKDVRLVVSEGVYRGGPFELVGGDNRLKQEGRLVVYKVYDEDGEIDHERTFDLAVFWKDYGRYDKLSLEYDLWDPDGKFNSQIAIYTPKVPESFDVKFSLDIETRWNGNVTARNELVEIVEK